MTERWLRIVDEAGRTTGYANAQHIARVDAVNKVIFMVGTDLGTKLHPTDWNWLISQIPQTRGS